ncbi:kicstor complex protein c12orf66 [Anaeramoeba flamelloides]|uniref:Kicstor complex protein c12orf66 n=1 Tax=Anaeramoeba flamelloides TaxID=1746091 RepID=A0AAV8ADL4_9EUKA|nr:kicstor complex protein c12orf66 [Anaeramoeba flamelloides]
MMLTESTHNYDHILKNQIFFSNNKKYINSHNIDFFIKYNLDLQNQTTNNKQVIKETRENYVKENENQNPYKNYSNLTDFFKLESDYLNMKFLQKKPNYTKEKKSNKNENINQKETSPIVNSLSDQYHLFSIFCEQTFERKKALPINLKNGAEEERYHGETNIKINTGIKLNFINKNAVKKEKEAENEITKNCKQFGTFSKIRITLIYLFEKLSYFSKVNKKYLYFEVLKTLITTLRKQQTILKNQNKIPKDIKNLIFLKKNMKLELEIMINLMETENKIVKFQFTKALFQLFKVKKLIKKWKQIFLNFNKINNLIQINQITIGQKYCHQKKHSFLYNYFFSKNAKTLPNTINNKEERKTEYPKLYLWVEQYYDLLISKMNLYYSSGLKKTHEVAKVMNRTKETDVIIDYIEQFVSKNKAKSFCLISNNSSVCQNSRSPILSYNCENRQNGMNNKLTIQFKKNMTWPNESQIGELLNWGISQYPTIFSYPKERQLDTGQYSSLISLVIDSQIELNKFKKIVHFYDKKLKLSFFLMKIQKNITAVLIYSKKKNNFDKKSFNFLTKLLKILSNQCLFQNILNCAFF